MTKSTKFKKNDFHHWLLGVALFMTAVFLIVAVVIINSEADSVSTSVSINNATPAVDSVYVSSSAGGGSDSYGAGIVLSSATTKTVHVNGVVSDSNGADDIADTDIAVKFYRSGATGAADCSVDNNDCYSVSGASCAVANASATTRTYTCPVALEFYTDATDSGTYVAQNWLARVTVTDTAGPAAANSTHSGVEVNSLLSLTIPGTIAYGSLAMGASTTNLTNKEQTISQAGNTIGDVEVSSAAAMSCTSGTIPISNQEWAVTDVSYASGVDLTSGAVDTNLAVAIRTDDSTNTSKILYWNIGIPEASAGGTCTGTTTISAIAGS